MAEENGRVCAVCGKPLTGRQERYCSKRCKGKAERNRLRESRPEAIKVCQNCGKEFVADHKNRKYCSDECEKEGNRKRHAKNKRAKKKKPVIICAWCGKEFVASHANTKYCSDECRIAAMRGRYVRKAETITKICQNCGKEFVADPKNRKYCSEECKKEQHKAQVLRYRMKKRAKKKKPVIICAVCGREFEGWNTGAKYCSAECRIVARRSEATTKICAHCGKEFTGRGGSKFCSDECRKAVINQERAAEKSKLNGLYCKVCGKPLTGRQRTVCSVHCASRRHAEKTKQTAIKPQKAARVINKTARRQRKADKQSKKKERFCKVCGKPLTGRQTAYCSKDCAKKRNAEKIKQAYYKPAPRICKNCGKEFVSSKVRRYCSDECKMAGIMKERAAEKSKLNGRFCMVCGKALTGRQRTVCSTVCASKRSKAALKQAKQQNEPQTQICKNCGKEFVVMPGRRYCSDECREAARAQRLDARKNPLNGLFCKICGKPLTGKQSMFCSPECERKRGRADKKHIPRICENCGKAFEGSRVQRFCSKECKYAAIKQKKAEGKSKPNGLFCKVCGEPLTGIQRIFCSTRCENRYYRKQRAEREKENTKD